MLLRNIIWYRCLIVMLNKKRINFGVAELGNTVRDIR